MLTRRKPYEGESVTQWRWRICTTRFRQSARWMIAWPRHSIGCSARAMAKDPDKRYQSAGELAYDALAAVEGRPDSAPSTSASLMRSTSAVGGGRWSGRKGPCRGMTSRRWYGSKGTSQGSWSRRWSPRQRMSRQMLNPLAPRQPHCRGPRRSPVNAVSRASSSDSLLRSADASLLSPSPTWLTGTSTIWTPGM